MSRAFIPTEFLPGTEFWPDGELCDSHGSQGGHPRTRFRKRFPSTELLTAKKLSKAEANSLRNSALRWILAAHRKHMQFQPTLGNVQETPTRTTCPKSTAVHPPFVRQYAPHLYRRTFLASKPWRKGKPTVHLPFVRQYASHLYGSTTGRKNTGGWGHRNISAYTFCYFNIGSLAEARPDDPNLPWPALKQPWDFWIPEPARCARIA